MLAGLDARQLAEMYAFARVEPLDQPLQRMLAELSATVARSAGQDLKTEDFMLTGVPAAGPSDDKALRSQQIFQLFARASKHNNKVH